MRFPQFIAVTGLTLICAVAAGHAQTPAGAAPLTAAQERVLKPKDTFVECADCPEMVVVPAGSFTMGSPDKEEDITTAFLRAGARVTVVVLDACRNNPFASAGTKGIGDDKGLAPHEPPGGVFTFYAASRGEAALDRLYDGDADPNSVFTRVLLPALARPDLDLPTMAREVREEATGAHRQPFPATGVLKTRLAAGSRYDRPQEGLEG